MRNRQVPIIEKETTVEIAVIEEEETKEEEKLFDVLEQPSLEDIRNTQRQNIAKEQEEKQKIALDYTRKSFALYLSDDQLDILCRNVLNYINNQDAEGVQPVKIKDLNTVDLRHFGWNIWNFYKPRNQMDIAHFLKKVFPDIFKDVELETIKRHLKDDERKGILKIQEDISKKQ